MKKWWKKKPSKYETENERLWAKLRGTEPGSPEWNTVMNDILKMQTVQVKDKEMNQFFDKQGRGQIVAKIVGFLGLGGLAAATMKFEKDGRIFTGHSNGIISSIWNLGSRFFG